MHGREKGPPGRPAGPTALVLLGLLGGLASACGGEAEPLRPPADVDLEAEAFRETIEKFDLRPLPETPYPPDNPRNLERVALGKMLFFDPILGGESAPRVKEAARLDPYRARSHDVACATCHFPGLAFGDGRRLGAGVSGARHDELALGPDRDVPGPSLVTGAPLGTEARNSPTVLNAALNGRNSTRPRFDSFQFMDGRVAGGLEEQAIQPIADRDEMAGDAYGLDFADPEAASIVRDSVTLRIRGIPAYVARFREAFPGEVAVAEDIAIEHIGRALAAYQRELVTPGSRYDRFVAGDFAAFDAREKEGFRVVFGKGLCADCHRGPMLSDFTFRVLGVGDAYDEVLAGFPGKSGTGTDFGRFHADEERLGHRKFAFRVPTLRNVELTAPYFHSGSAATLRETVEFYDRGGRGEADISDRTLAEAGVRRDPFIEPLDLTEEEIEAVVAFLKTLTAPVQDFPIDLVSVPERVPSGLLPPGVPTPEGPGPDLPEAGISAASGGPR